MTSVIEDAASREVPTAHPALLSEQDIEALQNVQKWKKQRFFQTKRKAQENETICFGETTAVPPKADLNGCGVSSSIFAQSQSVPRDAGRHVILGLHLRSAPDGQNCGVLRNLFPIFGHKSTGPNWVPKCISSISTSTINPTQIHLN